MKPVSRKSLFGVVAVSALSLAWIGSASAHCDAMDGPVISEAQVALSRGDVTPLLKWVPAADEPQLEAVFEQAVRVRQHGGDALELADRQLFATLVRVHRAAEGAPFTGIKPAGAIDPAVKAADAALASGDIDTLVAKLTGKFEQRVREQFTAAAKSRARADDSVAEGREFVREYVRYVHYVEGVHNAIAADTGHGGGDARQAAGGHAH